MLVCRTFVRLCSAIHHFVKWLTNCGVSSMLILFQGCFSGGRCTGHKRPKYGVLIDFSGGAIWNGGTGKCDGTAGRGEFRVVEYSTRAYQAPNLQAFPQPVPTPTSFNFAN